MKLRSFVTLIAAFAVITAQRSHACAPSCASDSTTSQQVVNKTIERVLVSGVEEAQWRGMCHSFCVTVSCFMLQIYRVTSAYNCIALTGSCVPRGVPPFIVNST